MNDNFHKGSIKQERPSYSYEDTPNDNDNDLDADSDSGTPESRGNDKDHDGKGKKKYSVIPQSVREKFIKRVLSKEVTIKEVIFLHYCAYFVGGQGIWFKILHIKSYSADLQEGRQNREKEES
jgi:hypothetical protein